jgi:hypothetical protein
METFRKSQSELEENPNSDYLITPGAEDSISSISWHPKNEDIIAAGSWYVISMFTCVDSQGLYGEVLEYQ